MKRSSAISKHVSFWAGQIPAGRTSPKGTISEMAARAFYCCLYAMRKQTYLPDYKIDSIDPLFIQYYWMNEGWFINYAITKELKFLQIAESSFAVSRIP